MPEPTPLKLMPDADAFNDVLMPSPPYVDTSTARPRPASAAITSSTWRGGNCRSTSPVLRWYMVTTTWLVAWSIWNLARTSAFSTLNLSRLESGDAALTRARGAIAVLLGRSV